MIRIEIKTEEVRTISGTSNKTGKPYTIRDQEGYAWMTDKNGNPRAYPERISLQLEDSQQPYKPGVYMLLPGSIYVGDFGRLQLGRPQLSPVAQPATKAA